MVATVTSDTAPGRRSVYTRVVTLQGFEAAGLEGIDELTAPLAGLAPPLFAGIETGAEYMVKVEVDWDAEHETDGPFEFGMQFTPVDVGMSSNAAFVRMDRFVAFIRHGAAERMGAMRNRDTKVRLIRVNRVRLKLVRNQQGVRVQARFVDLAIDADEGGDVDEEGGVGAAPPADPPPAAPEAAPPKGVGKEGA